MHVRIGKRTTDGCQYNKPALTLDYPAERASLGPELDDRINSALCWWTSGPKDESRGEQGVVEREANSTGGLDGTAAGAHLARSV